MNILTLYNICYIILTTYIIDSALEPSYNLSKNLLLLPWILKLIVIMVDDSTPLFMGCWMGKSYQPTKEAYREPTGVIRNTSYHVNIVSIANFMKKFLQYTLIIQ